MRIINFHGIGSPKRELEAGEAAYWISVDRYCHMLDRINTHPDRANLVITFDDGNISDLEIGLPELLARGLTAEFFVLTGRLGRSGSLGEADVRTLLSKGMQIGSHGIGHKDWSALSSGELEQELISSKERLEAVCTGPVRFAAIPFGRYNARVLSYARKAGYEAVYSSDGGTMTPGAFLRARSSVRSDTDDSSFQAMLDGRLPVARRLRRAASMTLKQFV